MKKFSVFLSLLFLATIYSIAQVSPKSMEISWGKEEKSSSRATLSDIISYDETGFYALKTKAKIGGYDNILVHYDQHMNPQNTAEIKLKDKKSIEWIVEINKELYLFYSRIDSKTKTNNLYFDKINKKTLALSNEEKKVAEIDYSGKSRSNSGSFDYVFSKDRSKFMIYYSLPYEKKGNENLGFQVFDNSMMPIWNKQIVLPYTDELHEVSDYTIDNGGNLHLLGKLYNEKKKEKVKGKVNFKYNILSYYNSGNEFKEFPVEIEGKFLTDMQIAINKDQDIICAGFYSNTGTYSIGGSYFLKINSKTKEMTVKSFKEFGMDFITQFMTEKEEKKAKKKAEKGKDVELYEYDLDDIILREDGGAMLIGEQYFIREHTYTTTGANGSTTTRTVYYYYYNDIIVLNISPDGSIDWTTKIPKRQVSINDGGFFSSYTMAIVNDKLYFVFNDNAKNLSYKDGGKLYNFAPVQKSKDKSVVTLVELDHTGKFTRQALFTAKEAEVITRPKVCEQISNNELLIFGQKKKAHKFAKVTFKQDSL